MSTHTHTRAEGTGGSINKFRVTTQNMGGFGLEVRSHKNLRKSAERNATDVFVLTLSLAALLPPPPLNLLP